MGKLLRAVDLTIVELASWVLFNAATPTFSVTTYGPQELELKETVELPSRVCNDALQVFEGLGLFSSKFSILEYTRGHDLRNLRPQQKSITIRVNTGETGHSGMVKEDESEWVQEEKADGNDLYITSILDCSQLASLQLVSPLYNNVDEKNSEEVARIAKIGTQTVLADMQEDVAALEKFEACVQTKVPRDSTKDEGGEVMNPYGDGKSGYLALMSFVEL